jgi:predicted branched-subunit amino acid permease
MIKLDLFRHLPVRHEHAMGLGLLTTARLLWVVWRNRTQSAVRLAIMVAIAIALLVTMFPGRIQLWTLLYLCSRRFRPCAR